MLHFPRARVLGHPSGLQVNRTMGSGAHLLKRNVWVVVVVTVEL